MGTPRRRGVVGQELLQLQQGSGGQQGQIRPQLRPQRSLDNRLPSSTQPQLVQELSTHQSMVEPQGNIYATNNNVNTQSLTHTGLGPLDNQAGSNQMGNQMGKGTSAQELGQSQHGPMGLLHGQGQGGQGLTQQHPGGDPYHTQPGQQGGVAGVQQQGMFGPILSGPGAHDPQRSIQQSQQVSYCSKVIGRSLVFYSLRLDIVCRLDKWCPKFKVVKCQAMVRQWV